MPNKNFKCISVIGLGYIGLPTAAIFASKNIEVIGVDVNPHTVETINRGEIHIVEPDLDVVVRQVVQNNALRATLVPEPAEAFLITVPTPFKGVNREPDLSYIESAANKIAPVLEKGNLVILESTSPVGATEIMSKWLADARPDLTFPQTHGEEADIHVAHCPERVMPGKTMQELITNDRVIGGMTPRCSKMAAQLYKTFVTGECVIASSPRAAELAKLAENSFRDVNIAFANELSLICDDLNVDVWELISLSNRHPRVEILRPGPGVGGHCIAVDPWFVVSSAPESARLIRTAREVNNYKPNWVLKKIDAAIERYLDDNPDKTRADVCVGCFGLAFKPDVDDLRESPAVEIVRRLADQHPGKVLAVEPNIVELPRDLAGIELVGVVEGTQRADVHVYLVAHQDFVSLSKHEKMLVDFVGLS